MYAITGAGGHRGGSVLERPPARCPADPRAAPGPRPAGADALRAKGVTVREADYDRPETLRDAFQGVRKLLLVSSSEIGKRTPQHRAVIDAARAAGVALIAYMSSLTSLGYTATQYALLSSTYALPGKFLKGFSGVVVERLQPAHGMIGAYAVALLGAGLIALPSLLLFILLKRLSPAEGQPAPAT